MLGGVHLRLSASSELLCHTFSLLWCVPCSAGSCKLGSPWSLDLGVGLHSLSCKQSNDLLLATGGGLALFFTCPSPCYASIAMCLSLSWATSGTYRKSVTAGRGGKTFCWISLLSLLSAWSHLCAHSKGQGDEVVNLDQEQVNGFCFFRPWLPSERAELYCEIVSLDPYGGEFAQGFGCSSTINLAWLQQLPELLFRGWQLLGEEGKGQWWVVAVWPTSSFECCLRKRHCIQGWCSVVEQ